MKLSLRKLFFSRVMLFSLFILCVAAFNTNAQTVTCPSTTDLGTDTNPVDCNSIDLFLETYPQVNSLADAAEIYDIQVADPQYQTGVVTIDSELVFYCESDARSVTREIIIYNDDNYNFSYDEGEEVTTCTFTIATIADTTAPTFTIPDDFTTTCELGTEPEVTGFPDIEPNDGCPDLTIDFVNKSDAPLTIGGCPGEKILVRSWVATDPCGNANDPQTQTIIIEDVTGPDFTVPADIDVPCGTDPMDVSITGDVTDGFDLCEEAAVDVVGRIVMNMTLEDTPCPGFTTYTKRWGAMDRCGNATTKDQIIVVECPVDCSNTDICLGDIVTDPLPDECDCQIVEEQVIGCTDPEAINFNDAANCECDASGENPGNNECCQKDFDLALMKVLTSAGPFTIGTAADVTFTITVSNQGDVTAQNIEITDYTPTGLILNDANWTASGANAVTTIAGPLASGESTTVDITYTIDPDVSPGTYTNFAEISAAEDDMGNPGMDIDSDPDNDPDNDNYTDDVINEDGMNGGDEDDHDGAEFTLDCATPTCNTDSCVGDVTVLSADGCTCEVSVPQVLGCTDATACNFNPDANCDDGSCMAIPTCNTDPCVGDVEQLSADQCSCEVATPQVLGCTDDTACNYNPDANCDDGSCAAIPTCNTDPCVGDVEVLSADQCSCEVSVPQVLGCTDATACNFNPDANCDDGSCAAIPTCNTDPCVGDVEVLSADQCSCEVSVPQVLGCTDATACNFNPDANCDDGSCMAIPTCNTDPCVGDVEVLSADQCSCEVSVPQVLGCTDATACNFNPDANCDDGSCAAIPTCNTDPCVGDIEQLSADECSCELVTPQVLGCTDSTACNYNPDANCDDGSCAAIPVCNTDPCLDGGIQQLSADQCSCEVVTPTAPGCTDENAINYNPDANCDDGTCVDPEFDLALDKEIITPGPYSAGQDITYSITITNEGNVATQNICVKDDVPSDLTFNAALSPGWTFDGASVTTTIAGPLQPGESASVNITFTINADAGEGSITNTAEICGFEDLDGNMPPDKDSTPDNNVPGEDDIDMVTIMLTCLDEAGNMATALITVCGGDNVNAPASGAVVPAGSVQVYLLHDGTASTIYDFNSNGTFINDGSYPANVQLYISSVVGPNDGTGFPNLSSSCTDIADGTPVIFYDPIRISHMINCDKPTGTASVNFSITGGGPAASGGTYSVTGSYNGAVNPGQQYIISGISDGSTYSITVIDDGKGCTAFTDPVIVSCTKTPIELISYNGKAEQDGNLLKWVTASEIENAFFTLERATPTTDFVEIHQQAGAGTYSLPSKYSYIDREAPNGLSYYRLKQTDIDGTTVEVGVVEIQRSEPTFDIINIHPIPVLDNFDLFIDSEEDQTVEVNIYNSIGELMHVKTYELTNAVNKVNIDVSIFTSGVYVVSAIAGENVISHKIIKY